jgi:hypothetical protein
MKIATGALAPALAPAEITYLAMRAGPIDSASIRARAGSLSAALKMVRMGHATVSTDGLNQIYRLTPEGRAACPSRRQVEREIVMAYPGVMA